MIRVKPRAAVPKEFTDKMVETARLRLKTIQTDLQGIGDHHRKHFIDQNGIAIARMKQLLKDPLALDMEVTRLRGLPFEKYWIEVHQDICYFAGQTKEIIIHSSQRWSLGPYNVYMPQQAFIQGATGRFAGDTGPKFHFIPVWKPNTFTRHMHHVSNSTFDYSYSRNPLDMSSSTCWGGFGPIILGNAKDSDVVEAFRTIYTYLSRYDAGDPLLYGGLSNVDHKRLVTA